MKQTENSLWLKNMPKKQRPYRASNSLTLWVAPITKVCGFGFGLLLLAGCLQTRANLKQDSAEPKYNTPKAVVVSEDTLKKAEVVAKSEDLNTEFRQLNGRIEVVEAQLQSVKDNEYVKGLEAKLLQMEQKITLLETTVADLNAKSKADAAKPAPAPIVFPKSAGPMDAANSHFENKHWEDAILAFEEYRKKYPKGDDYALATYRIGLSFQNLGLKEDAKAFFKEVVDKFPKSKEAGLAKTKLKKL